MSTVNNSEEVKKQYADSGKLNTRISIHDKYSVNKQGFGNWIFSNYRIEPGMKVLELGCGTGDMWKGHGDVAERCAELVLSDFSEGMIETTKRNLGALPNTEYRVIDIQDIPYADGEFDIVIASQRFSDGTASRIRSIRCLRCRTARKSSADSSETSKNVTTSIPLR